MSFKGVYCKRKTPLWIYNNQPNQSSHTFQSSISCDKPITAQIHVRCVEQRRRREDKIITRQHDLKNNSFWTFLLFLLLRSTHTKSIRTCFCSIGVKNVKFKTFGFLLENCVSELNSAGLRVALALRGGALAGVTWNFFSDLSGRRKLVEHDK